MKTTRIIILMMLCALALSACNMSTSTDDTNNDVEAAQSFFPDLAGYNRTDADSIIDAVTTTLGGASLVTGNPIAAVLIERADTMIECYQDVGAADARIYSQRINITEPSIPTAGVLTVVNQNRVVDNFLHCLTQNPLSGAFSAQSVQPEPCYGYGTFNFNGDNVSFFYVATDTPLCDQFNASFAQYNPSGDRGALQIPSGVRGG
ncbi:MAG: hypothetical protein RLP44_18795 [Aggregatilineales bacterium]